MSMGGQFGTAVMAATAPATAPSHLHQSAVICTYLHQITAKKMKTRVILRDLAQPKTNGKKRGQKDGVWEL